MWLIRGEPRLPFAATDIAGQIRLEIFRITSISRLVANRNQHVRVPDQRRQLERGRHLARRDVPGTQALTDCLPRRGGFIDCHLNWKLCLFDQHEDLRADGARQLDGRRGRLLRLRFRRRTVTIGSRVSGSMAIAPLAGGRRSG